MNTTEWHAGDRFMLRVAGLPLSAVDALRATDTRRWAEDVLAAEAGLRAGAQRLSDVLHEAVGATDPAPDGAGATQRRALLRLRRQIHNDRLPARPDASTETAMEAVAAVDEAAAEHLAGWLHRRRLLEKLLAEGEPLLTADLARNRAALRELVADDRLRLGLLLASPVLEGQLDGYARAKGVPSGRARKAERSVLSYVYRTACKTSPFSTFTGVATGRFTEDAAGADGIRVADAWSSHVRLNVVVLARLAELILADPVRRRDLPLRLASGWGHEEDRIRYVRRSVTAGDDAAAVTFDAVKDRLFFLRRSGTLERLLALFAERPELRHAELADWLAAEHSADAADCEAYVCALLQLGMVRVPCLDTEVHSADPLRSFQRSLASLERPWSDRLAALLEAPAAALADYPAAGQAERAALLRVLRAGLHRAQEELGSPDAALPQTLLYEDVSAGRALPCAPRDWSALRSVERILPAFDLTLAGRITFEGFFTARYGAGGRCEDLLGLVHDFHEDFFDQYLSFTARRKPFDEHGEYVAEVNWLGLPGIRALDAARRAFVGRMRQAWSAYEDTRATAASHPDVIRLDEADLAAVASELSPVTSDFAPRCHHLQLARDPADGTALTVLNRSYGGLSFPFSRFTHVYDGQGEAPSAEGPGAGFSGALRATAGRVTPPGAVFAEVTGGPVTTNLNLHGQLTDYEIVCPGESGTLPPERRLHLDDLYAEHVPRTGRVVLRSRRLGCEVIPVYLGYLVPLALPAIPRTLLLLSPSSMSPLDVWAGVPEGADRDGVTTRPRVVHGDVVLSRRSWTTTAGALPVQGAQEASHFLAWQRWRHAHGLPEQVFATVSAGPSAAGAKPQYVDFAGLLSLAAFETLLRDPAHRVVFREMLPDPDGLHVHSARGAHVAELAVETHTLTLRDQEGGARCRS
ncbi:MULTISPECIES: lantibiotic dehydratase [unclassified Streptomyces]|uniref:lantibiotic dehydratase n=1 Tax=unclassified Streptomyces TaxID=2593676 RepID=UPI0022565A7C|nr:MULTISPECIES: lantibiotic dehydratase [unclassified Streptomyces]MCX4524134.1 lantibiotic dehydratase family protein [Streptomyces sp. NBC_01551]MCX4545347.1 lantibiotic dehydratase family protein [Streptomyces sp. NBC_01565]